MSEQDRIAEARRKLLEKRLKGTSEAGSAVVLTVAARPADAPVRATPGQERLWVLQQLQPEGSAYNMLQVTRLRGVLNADRLETAIQQLIRRHESLRVGFVMQSGQLLQQIEPEVSVPLIRQQTTEGQLESMLLAIAEQPFDLAQAPLIRVALLEIAPDDHVLLLVLHHIICDEWSQDVFWKELAVIYATQQELPALPIQYADYAYWQRQQAYEKQLQFWREELSGDLPLLQLLTDHLRPAVQTFNGRLLLAPLSRTLTDALQNLSETSGVTLFMTLFAAYALLLHRYSGQSDLLIGTPVANRKYAELENLIGFFLNTIVLRVDFSQDVTFRAYLDTIRQRALQALANADVPFDQVVDAIKPKRDPAFNPLFQAMFVFQDHQGQQPALADLTLERIQLDAQVSKFDVTLFVQTTANGLQIGLEYNTDLFDAEPMQRMIQVYQTLLQSIVNDPAAPLSQLQMLPQAERAALLELGSGADVPYPQDRLIHDLIADHPAQAVAIQSESGSMTYGELNERANQVAHYLRALGVDRGVAVGLCVERSAEMLIAIVGILRAGGAYVPIDPDYPQERIRYMLADAGIRILLTQDMLKGTFAQAGATIIALDNNPRLDMQDSDAPATTTTPDDLAYIIYTSGSTGQPKGVRIRHRNLVHSTVARYSFYPHPAERFLLLSSYAFDSSVVGIFWTLCAGGTLCLPPHQGERDINLIAALIEKYRITHLLALPSLYQILLELAAGAALRSLNTVMVAGEACPIALVRQHYQQLPDCRLYNEYGPTEGTVWSSAWEIPPDASKILIGKPIPNMQAYVLDRSLQPVPVGVRGELFIAGAGIAEGYHNRPELTAERFVENPFGAGKLYRTGDLASLHADGNIEFFGRIDYQVKISGYRIELGEIESALLQHDAVREAVVLAVSGQPAAARPPLVGELLAELLAQDAAALLAEIERMSDAEVASILSVYTGGN